MNERQARFVDEYLVDLNATQAAIRAGYSAKRADAIGYENLRKPEISKAVQKLQTERAEKLLVSAEDVLQSILDIRSRAMAGDKLNEALKSNELIGKHLGMFKERVEHSVDESIANLLSERLKRVDS